MKPLFRAFAIVLLAYALPNWASTTHSAIATAHPLATDAGASVLKQGGNAFDAAVAISATLAVVEPYSSGIGGGGFWLLHRAKDGKQIMLDGRETAPMEAHRDLYLDKNGQHDQDRSLNGPLAAGIPGVPKALEHLALHYGRLPLAQSLAPAIQLARNGVPVDAYMQHMITLRRKALSAYPAAARVFLPEGEVPAIGHRLVQTDLAKTLQQLARHGTKGFYQGDVAERLVEGVRQAGGIWQQQDLLDYKVIERTPVSGQFHGMKIISAAPPSSGGIALVQMFNMLEQLPYTQTAGPKRNHLIVEAMRRAYRDRAAYLGDSDFVAVPVARLTHKTHAKALIATIDPERATPSNELEPVMALEQTGKDTSHFSIIDAEGNRVAATLSINIPFGSGFMPPGTGVILNDEMDDFSAKPGSPNIYGLIGNEANAIAPGKRPLSSMSPTFLESERGIAVLGTPGGSRIITMVLLAALDYFQGGDAQSMVDLPRFHHQYLPDRIQIEENSFQQQELDALSAMGHSLKAVGPGYDGSHRYGNMQAVTWDRSNNRLQAASDPRGIGKAIVIE
jgi:gamma-glutamyltranspeptidase/glutathione hydrolase